MSDELRAKIRSILRVAYDNINLQLDWDVADAAMAEVAPLLAEKDATIELGRTEHVEFREYVLRDQQIMGALAERLTAERDAARADLRALRSWAGLMSILDEHYPAAIFDGTSGDSGPAIVTLIRQIHALRGGVVSDGD